MEGEGEWMLKLRKWFVLYVKEVLIWKSLSQLSQIKTSYLSVQHAVMRDEIFKQVKDEEIHMVHVH